MNIGDMLFSPEKGSKRAQESLEPPKGYLGTNESSEELKTRLKRSSKKTSKTEEEVSGNIVAQETTAPETAPESGTKEKPVYTTYEDYNYEDLLTYAGIDTYGTSTVISRLFPQLVVRPDYRVKEGPSKIVSKKAPALIEVYESFTSTIFDFVCDLELNGINYDQAANRRLDKAMREEVATLEDRIFSSIGKRINLDSADVLGEFLYSELGLEAPHKTKSGSDSTDGAALLTLAGLDTINPGDYVAKDPAKQFLADIAKRKNLASVHRGFISTYIEDYVQPDGRVHALYNQFGTSTFRLSSSDPNLQNIPRAFGVKVCFNCRPGYVIVYADLSSAEVRCLAAICGDEGMLKAVREGLDFHSFSASAMYNVPYEEFVAIVQDKGHERHKEYKARRQTAKTLTFSLLYGSSANGIAMQLNLTVPEADALMAMYFSAFPGVKTYIEQTHAAARLNQYVITPFGHRRQFYGVQDVFKGTAAYNAGLRGSQNYIIQSTTSVIGCVMFAQINREIKKLGGVCTATIHDALSSEVPIEHASKAIEVFFYYMRDWPKSEWSWLGLDMDCEVEIGYNWKALEGVTRGTTQADAMGILTTLAR
jgi:DNA polymerase I-like protein with 3'-5' exonuclease and polymerase domains